MTKCAECDEGKGDYVCDCCLAMYRQEDENIGD